MNQSLRNHPTKSNAAALLPFAVFIAIYLGAGLILQMQGVEMAFYQFPSVAAMFLAVIVAFFLTKGDLSWGSCQYGIKSRVWLR